jgi:hypothetical protein
MYREILDLRYSSIDCCQSRGPGVVRGNGQEDKGHPSSKKYSSGSALLVFVYTQAL